MPPNCCVLNDVGESNGCGGACSVVVQTGEAICAGMKADGNIVLVHGKIMANGVLLTVRTKDPGFTQTCLDICKNAL